MHAPYQLEVFRCDSDPELRTGYRVTRILYTSGCQVGQYSELYVCDTLRSSVSLVACVWECLARTRSLILVT
jgi:hypothetical protein